MSSVGGESARSDERRRLRGRGGTRSWPISSLPLCIASRFCGCGGHGRYSCLVPRVSALYCRFRSRAPHGDVGTCHGGLALSPYDDTDKSADIRAPTVLRASRPRSRGEEPTTETLAPRRWPRLCTHPDTTTTGGRRWVPTGYRVALLAR